MLKALEINEINEASALTWRLCNNSNRKSYPLFQSLVEIEEEYRSRIDKRCSALMGYYKNERLIGVMCYYYQPEEMYLQTTSLAAEEDTDAVFNSFLLHIQKNHPGYDVYIGVTAENISIINSLISFGYKQVEASSDTRLNKSSFINNNASDNIIERIDKASFHEYYDFHKAHFDNLYWNADRIRDKLVEWYIFVVKEGGVITGGLFMNVNGNAAEIFGMAMDNLSEKNSAVVLLSKAIDVVFHEDPEVSNVIFFVDIKDEINLLAAVECGFGIYSRYCCFTAKIKTVGVD